MRLLTWIVIAGRWLCRCSAKQQRSISLAPSSILSGIGLMRY